MKAELIVTAMEDEMTAITISHGGDLLSWNATVFDKSGLASPELLFKDINGYWERLSAEKQQGIWNTYCAIHESMNGGIGDGGKLQDNLIKLVEQLFTYHQLNDINYYVQMHSTIRIPSNLKEMYGPDDPPVRTYLKSDYQQLVNMAIALRPMVPIWGAYILRIRASSGNIHKEHQALALLSKANIMFSEPMERLRLYVDAAASYAPQSFSAILNGLGTSEVPEWLLAVTLIRRVAMAQISTPDDKNTLITNIFNSVTNALVSLDRQSGGRVVEKYRDGDTAVADDNSSNVESYKIKEDVAAGTTINVSVYSRKVKEIANILCPDLPPALLDTCLSGVKNQLDLKMEDHILTITQWMCKRAIATRSMPHLEKLEILDQMAICQAILWHWGFYDLAALLTASAVGLSNTFMLGSDHSRAKISKDLLVVLEAMYPYYPRPTSKEKSVRQYNLGCKAVDVVCRTLTLSDWYIHAPQELLSLSSAGKSTRKMIVPGDIKNQLAALIIKLDKSGGSRNEAFKDNNGAGRGV